MELIFYSQIKFFLCDKTPHRRYSCYDSLYFPVHTLGLSKINVACKITRLTASCLHWWSASKEKRLAVNGIGCPKWNHVLLNNTKIKTRTLCDKLYILRVHDVYYPQMSYAELYDQSYYQIMYDHTLSRQQATPLPSPSHLPPMSSPYLFPPVHFPPWPFPPWLYPPLYFPLPTRSLSPHLRTLSLQKIMWLDGVNT